MKDLPRMAVLAKQYAEQALQPILDTCYRPAASTPNHPKPAQASPPAGSPKKTPGNTCLTIAAKPPIRPVMVQR